MGKMVGCKCQSCKPKAAKHKQTVGAAVGLLVGTQTTWSIDWMVGGVATLGTNAVPLVEAGTSAVVPLEHWSRRRGIPIPCSSQAQAGCSHQSKGQARAHEATHLRVRSHPLPRESRSQFASCSLALLSLESVHREHEGSELAPGCQAAIQVLALLFVLVLGQDLDGILATIRRRIGVSHSDVEDGRRTPLPEASATDVASALWWDGCGASGGTHLHTVLTGWD